METKFNFEKEHRHGRPVAKADSQTKAQSQDPQKNSGGPPKQYHFFSGWTLLDSKNKNNLTFFRIPKFAPQFQSIEIDPDSSKDGNDKIAKNQIKQLSGVQDSIFAPLLMYRHFRQPQQP